MKDFILGAAIGYLLARYFLLNMEKQEYLTKEAETLDNIKNKVHDLINQVAPDLSDEEIVIKVEETVKPD